MGLTVQTCIIVDDDVQITELFSELMSLQGLTVLATGHNGLDAIKLYEKHNPDVVFLDVEMPKLNGIQALKEIKEIDSSANVVIVTGSTSGDIEKQLKENGVTEIVYKPFDIKKIGKIIESLNDTVSIYQ
ncbi:response regulator [Nitrosopumilus adriaticus]|uniref:Response regulator receiver protein n=1 Tax=Nitrosopumilus adriaticus TaxID=1580092 RepID=A0A0D5C315_9ARCH|nr:response regulator [Nitrosopumilus adriaticus]AJW70730.1 Response regulator receiver protein [Nitrosopumilus adriaticus]